LEKNISVLAKATQVSDVAHGPLVGSCRSFPIFFSESNSLATCGFDSKSPFSVTYTYLVFACDTQYYTGDFYCPWVSCFVYGNFEELKQNYVQDNYNRFKDNELFNKIR
jgi:hypothetical protein